MSRAKRRRLEKESARQSTDTQSVESTWDGRRILIIISISFIVLVLAIIGINHYFSEDQKYYRIDIIHVDDDTIGMDYFVKRCHATGSDPMNALTGLTKELILKKEAEAAGLEISDQAVQDKLIEMAQGNSEVAITQSEFKEWLKQTLNKSKLTEEEYREIVRYQLIGEAFYDVISMSTPTTTEQVHAYVIVVPSEEEALEVRSRFEAGESFADLAAEYSMDAMTREEGGDAGWLPRGVIYESRFDSVLFDELQIGEMSEPMPYYDYSTASSAEQVYVQYFLFTITEKAASREIDEEYLEDIYYAAYDSWMGARMTEHQIKYSGINNGFDSETYSWINWQLQKMTRENNEDE